jgi:lambda repressor-like predicted transcriptional regulator
MISYTTRDFQSIRLELINYVRTYYPDLIQNVNDASVFSVLLDLNAAVTDNLNYHIDRSLQETVLQFAQQSSSLYNIARTYGLKIPGMRPSISIVNFSIQVPAFGDAPAVQSNIGNLPGPDPAYFGILSKGSQVIGAGQTFETLYDIDFGDDFNAEGFVNRLVIPNFNANNILINYTITKQEPVINGITKVFKRVINTPETRPFFEFFLPEKNVLGVTGVILKDGTNYNNVPSAQEFMDSSNLSNKWFEVDALAQDRIFIEDPSKPKDETGIKVGKYYKTNQRFITEYTPQGFLKLTFGGGNTSSDDLLRDFSINGVPLDISKYQNNFSLGSTLKANSTLFVQYRVGGGLVSNLGPGAITQLGTVNFNVYGSDQNKVTAVINSLTCNNVTASIGGANYPSIEEIRNLISFNFAAQNRAVTVNDYEAIIRKMPSKFGAPAKVAITETDNKINVQILSYDNTGALTETVSTTLKSNIATYLSNYRMMNDYIQISAANVIDLAFDIFVVLDNSQNQGIVISNIISKINTYMSPSNRSMGENLYISPLRTLIQSEQGVITVSSISVYNRVGGLYSSSQVSQSYSNPTTKEIRIIEDTIYAQPNQIFNVRYQDKDIRVSVKNLTTVNFS